MPKHSPPPPGPAQWVQKRTAADAANDPYVTEELAEGIDGAVTADRHGV
ncbi:MAG: hypothetical protein ACK4MD_07405 [Demequina sp.]